MQVAEHLRAREKALAKGDHGQVRAIDADLRRVGYPLAGEQHEQAAPMAAPPRRAKARPRCEHGRSPDRCVDCNPELEVAR